ncbi:MAG: hypothetical protein Q8P41_19565 [Pseudomonadota bacterium]|nr:hypothetical protein [Pseudomonadota bacterium]
MILLLATLAYAEGARCVATWRGPVPGCPIAGDLVASATRGSETTAERAARRQLARVLELTADELVERSGDRYNAEYVLCTERTLEVADVECAGQQSSMDGGLCFVTFDDPSCWPDGEVLTMENEGWRAVIDGRQAMCEAVDARLVRLAYRDMEESRIRCQESCVTRAAVSCPPDR